MDGTEENAAGGGQDLPRFLFVLEHEIYGLFELHTLVVWLCVVIF